MIIRKAIAATLASVLSVLIGYASPYYFEESRIFSDASKDFCYPT